jgi:hypothetical protein
MIIKEDEVNFHLKIENLNCLTVNNSLILIIWEECQYFESKSSIFCFIFWMWKENQWNNYLDKCCIIWILLRSLCKLIALYEQIFTWNSSIISSSTHDFQEFITFSRSYESQRLMNLVSFINENFVYLFFIL